MKWLRLNPVTKRRWRRFKEMRRAYWSLILITLLYGVSLFSEFIANDKPLYVRYQGKSYFPAVLDIFGRIYPDTTFTGSGLLTRPDYKKVNGLPAFAEGTGNFMIFAPIPYGPYEITEASSIDLPDVVTLDVMPEPHVGTVNLDGEGLIARSQQAAWFFGMDDEQALRGKAFSETWPIPARLRAAIEARMANQAAPAISADASSAAGEKIRLELTAYEPRSRPPESVRITLRQPEPKHHLVEPIVYNRAQQVAHGDASFLLRLSEADREKVAKLVRERFNDPVSPVLVTADGERYEIRFLREDVRFPFRPIGQHYLGLDSSGRDVTARILYALRLSMSFGLLLVTFSMVIGVIIGAVQGYYGGILDITAQRFIEIWSALPFLYIIILMGSVFGRSFMLLLFVYGLFHWIGISYYMRAEFLKLRREQFVEAAKVLGIPTWKILFKHILPNALVPIVTFFPFSLVGAIGILSALDYLGFGLPPPAASWGELLSQAQEFSHAWWLVVYPFVILFVVMLLGTFVGEGIRAAFDPRRFSRME